MKKEDCFDDSEFAEKIKSNIQEKGFAYEIDPNGKDVFSKYSTLPYRAYYSIADARIAFINNQKAKIRLTSQNDVTKDIASLESAITLMKFGKTIELNKDIFLRNYQITFNPRLLKKGTSWSMRYKDTDVRFIISTGAYIGSGDFELGDINNKIVEISGILHSQILALLKELKSMWPSEIFNQTLENLKLIALSNNALNL